jgi:hypothetical protein
MYRQILFAAIPGAHPLGQLKLFKFFPEKFVGRPIQISSLLLRQEGMKVQY